MDLCFPFSEASIVLTTTPVPAHHCSRWGSSPGARLHTSFRVPSHPLVVWLLLNGLEIHAYRPIYDQATCGSLDDGKALHSNQ